PSGVRRRPGEGERSEVRVGRVAGVRPVRREPAGQAHRRFAAGETERPAGQCMPGGAHDNSPAGAAYRRPFLLGVTMSKSARSVPPGGTSKVFSDRSFHSTGIGSNSRSDLDPLGWTYPSGVPVSGIGSE